MESTPTTPREPKKRCLNCEKKMPRKAVFCPACGQRDTDGKVQLKDLLFKLWSTVFHIDNKLFRTLAHLCVPAKITQEYFKGRMKRYLHPIQFYLLTMVFAVYVITQNATQNNKSTEPESLIFDRGKMAMLEEIKMHIDSLPDELKRHITAEAVDSAVAIKNRDLLENYKDSFQVKLPFLFDQKISSAHFSVLPLDSFAIVYKQSNRLNQYFLRQGIKSHRAGTGLGRSFMGSLTWTFLILIGIISGIVYWIFRKKGRYYVEHIVLMLHMHSFFFIVMGILVLMVHQKWLPENSFMFMAAGMVLYSFITVYRFYALPFWSTLWRWLLALACYLLVLFILLLSGYTLCILLF